MNLGLNPTYKSINVCTPEWLHQFVALAEDVGTETLWVAEHMAMPLETKSPYPYTESGVPGFVPFDPFPDPIEWLTWLAAITTDVKLCPGVIILPQHHPLQLAKRLATLDCLSNGRAMVGVGAGWQREELEAFGVKWSTRGRRMDECIESLRALWADGAATYEGEFVSFCDMASYPKPVQAGGVPIIVGGSTDHAARRAGRLGDGYFPVGVTHERLAELLVIMTASAVEAGRDPAAIELSVQAKPETTADDIKRFEEAGAIRCMLAVRSDVPFDEARAYVEGFVTDVLQKIPA
jgi:probable F420-dependent oxidoreductase